MPRLLLAAEIQDRRSCPDVYHADFTRFDIANGNDLFKALTAILAIANATPYLQQAVASITLAFRPGPETPVV